MTTIATRLNQVRFNEKCSKLLGFRLESQSLDLYIY